MDGMELKHIRESLGLTQVQLAEKVGLTATSIGRYEMPANVEGKYKVPHWLAAWVLRMQADAQGMKASD